MQKECNVRLITLDSCRYDTAKTAYTPTLNSLSKLRKGETYANFTYPAHQTFFIGKLPRIEGEENEYISGYEGVWRSTDARPTTKNILFNFDGPTIIDYHQRNGYNVQGFGGVDFFNNHISSSGLPSLFKNFKYFGPKQNTAPHKKMPRPAESMPLGNIDEIVDKTNSREPYFLFINCPSTHIPYDVPGSDVDDAYIKLIERLYREENLKKRYTQYALPFTEEEIEFLKQRQVEALEWADSQLAILFSELSNDLPTLTIVMADHGEEFGEYGRFGHVHNSDSVLFVPVWSYYSGD